MKFENTRVFGFESAMRGMRNPKNSWAKGDTREYLWANALGNPSFDPKEHPLCEYIGYDAKCVSIGPNDLKLAKALITGGPEHRKFLRQIFVSVDITAPLYWWKEFDTYKVGTVANSTSTMHKLTSQAITKDCFEVDDYHNFDVYFNDPYVIPENMDDLSGDLIEFCETLRKIYLETKDKKVWKELVRWLPEGWLQTRTVTMNYENLRAMCSKGQRRFHKLNEWSGIDDETLTNFISWARTLPYADLFIFYDPREIEQQKDDMLKEILSIFGFTDKDFYNEDGSLVTSAELGTSLISKFALWYESNKADSVESSD